MKAPPGHLNSLRSSGILLNLGFLALGVLSILLTVAWTSTKPQSEAFKDIPKESIVLVNTVYEKEGIQYQRKCRGILTSGRKILTALHCIPSRRESTLKYLRVTFVDDNINTTATRYGTGFKKLSRDMVVIRLNDEAPKTVPRVPLTPIAKNDFYFATAVLRDKNQHEYEFKTLTGSKRAVRGQSPEDFTIKLNKKSSQICHGDSGGPVFAYDNGAGRYRLVGVISYVAGSSNVCSSEFFTIENSLSPQF